MKRYLFLVLAAVVGFQIAHAEEPKVKVLNIEAAMRVWTERYSMLSPFKPYWYPRSDGIEPGSLPEDCFYGADLVDPVKAAVLVGNLYDEMSYIPGYLKEPANGMPANKTQIKGFSIYGIPYPDETNYQAVFGQLVDVLSQLRVIYLEKQTVDSGDFIFGKNSHTIWNASCYDAKQAAMNYLVQSSMGSGFITRREHLDADAGSGLYTSDLSLSKGKFRYDLSRLNGVARFAIRNSMTFNNVLVDDGVFNYTESPVVGGGWVSLPYGWASEDVTDFEMACVAPGGSGTLVRTIRSIVVVRPVFSQFIEDVWTECEICQACKTNCRAGKLDCKDDKLNLGISLGKGEDGKTSALNVSASLPSSLLSTPWALTPKLSSGVEAISDASVLNASGKPRLRQLKTAESLADIQVLDDYSYSINFYPLSQVGAKGADGFYAVSGSPVRILGVENPDRSSTVYNRIAITSTVGSLVENATYSYDTGAQGWALRHEADGKVRISTRASQALASPARRVETYTINDEDGNLVHKERNTYTIFPWNGGSTSPNVEELTESVNDPDGAALTTTYQYYEDGADTANYSRIKYRVEPSGAWHKFEYANGRVWKETTPLGSSSIGASVNIRVRVTNRVDGESETVIESVVSSDGSVAEVGRTYQLFDDNQIRTIQCAVPGAAIDSLDNLVSISTSYGVNSYTGEFAGKPYREVRPDGSGVLYRYRRVNGNVETTTYEGRLSAAYAAVNAPFYAGDTSGDATALTSGVKTVRLINGAGEASTETRSDIATGTVISTMVATGFDSFGRVTRRDYSDGTSEQLQYGCCGLDYSINREGIRTDYQYAGFGEVERIEQAGVATTTQNTVDADGLHLISTRIGSDETAVELSHEIRDLAGRLKSRREFGLRTTLFSEQIMPSGDTVKTTTLPDGGTQIETVAMDGRVKQISGTAVAPRKFEEGIDTGGYYRKEIMLGNAGEQTEWVKTYVDLLGRTVKTVYADAAFASAYYTQKTGRIARQIDLDGVQTLYAYDDANERVTVAVDLNRDGLIDYDGTDRITVKTHARTTRTDGGQTCLVDRDIVTAWDQNGVDAAITLSTVDRAMDGFTTWTAANGQTTKTVIAYTPATATRTETTTRPDNSTVTRIYVAGRLKSQTIADSTGVQLVAVSYNYDEHGRLKGITDARNGATTYAYYSGTDDLHTVTTPDPDPRTGAGYDAQVTTNHYDDAGRVNRITLSDGTETHTDYWPTGAVKRTWGSRTYPQAYVYDAQGRIKTLSTWRAFTDESTFDSSTGRETTTWNYDPARGWLTSKRYPNNTGPDYDYYASGRLKTRDWVRLYNGNRLRATYTYNTAGDLNGIDYADDTPDMSISEFDRFGRPRTVTDASGTRTLTYSGFGQAEDETYTAGLFNGLVVDRGYDTYGRLHSVSVPSLYAVDYDYDAASRLDLVTQGTRTAKYAYVPNSPLVQSVTFKDAGTVRQTTVKDYDYLNRLRSIANTPAPSIAYTVGYTYNDANQRTKATREDATFWDYGYDALGQVNSAGKKLQSGTVVPGHAYGFTFDDIGNRTQAVFNGSTSDYTPNDLNQYEQRTVPGVIDVLGEAQAAAVITYTADGGLPQPTVRQGGLFYAQLAVDNSASAVTTQLKVTGVKNNAGPAGEDAVSEITRTVFTPPTPEIYSHDEDGNLTADALWSYAWDGENRLKSMETGASAVAAGRPRTKLEFAYDGQGRRFAKKTYAWDGSAWVLTGSRLFLYDGWNLLAELDAQNANAVTRTYVWGLDLSGSLQGAGGVGGLLLVNAGTATHAVGYDGNGNVIGLVDMADGVRSATYEYGPFGDTLVADGPAAALNPYRFSTKFTDETGLLYYGLRYYNSSTGRWLSRDPIEERGGINIYGMVGNNLIGFFDAVGLEASSSISSIRSADGFERAMRKILDRIDTHILGDLNKVADLENCQSPCDELRKLLVIVDNVILSTTARIDQFFDATGPQPTTLFGPAGDMLRTVNDYTGLTVGALESGSQLARLEGRLIPQVADVASGISFVSATMDFSEGLQAAHGDDPLLAAYKSISAAGTLASYGLSKAGPFGATMAYGYGVASANINAQYSLAMDRIDNKYYGDMARITRDDIKLRYSAVGKAVDIRKMMSRRGCE